MKRLTKQPLAQFDLSQLIDYFAGIDLSLALRFIAAADATFERIRANPDIGFLSGTEDLDERDVRIKKIQGFPNHLIFFQETSDSVCVLRVLHASRDFASEFGD